jgi:quercetin dioxygenase-like cupin family protein
MRIVEFSVEAAEPIRLFESVSASSVALGRGHGEIHVYAIHFDADGEIGAHPTGFCQLFLVVDGSGWAEGEDGRRVALRAGQGAFFERGEMHSKGSETGMTAIMVQATHLAPGAERRASIPDDGR